MKYATGYDGKQLEFPDNIDPQVMDHAVAKYNAQAMPSKGWRGVTPVDTSPDPNAVPEWKRVAHDVVPSAAAMGLSLLVPGGGVVIPGMTRTIAPWIARAGAAYLGGAGGEMGTQGLTGDKIDPAAANARGIQETAAQLLGDLGVHGSQSAAETIYRGNLRAGVPATEKAIATQSRIAGAPVAADVADLAKQGLAERIPLGRGLTGTGTEKLAGITTPLGEDIGSALDASWVHGNTFTVHDALGPVQELKKELLNERGGTRSVAMVNRMEQELVDQFSSPATRRTPATPKQMTPKRLQELKQTWQDQADNYYLGAEKGVPDPKAQLKARFDAAIAKGARASLEQINTPSNLVGKTLGDIIAESNQRLSSLKPLGTAVKKTEAGIVSGTSGAGAPWYSHAIAPTLGASAGAVAHGAGGGLLGAAAGVGMDRLLSHPVSGSRIALLLSNPEFLKIAQQSPRAAIVMLNLLNGPAASDVTTQGGN